jgi:hypothetical protein
MGSHQTFCDDVGWCKRIDVCPFYLLIIVHCFISRLPVIMCHNLCEWKEKTHATAAGEVTGGTVNAILIQLREFFPQSFLFGAHINGCGWTTTQTFDTYRACEAWYSNCT